MVPAVSEANLPAFALFSLARTLPTGVLAAAIGSGATRGIVCPEACGGEAAWGGGTEVLAPATQLGLIHHFGLR
jgi:magnesium chelatase family protein